MKLLLDENLPIKLKSKFFKRHQISTVREETWSGKKSGEFLALMTLAGFEGLITISTRHNPEQ